jgi:hypothetical protein
MVLFGPRVWDGRDQRNRTAPAQTPGHAVARAHRARPWCKASYPRRVPATLPEGLYEHLVTEALGTNLDALDPAITRKLRELDRADAHVALSRHIAREVERALAALPADKRSERQVEITNALLARLLELVPESSAEEAVQPPGRQLLDGLAKREWLEDAVRRLGAHDTPRFPLAEAHHEPPTPHCYWVVPGRLLAGAYPEGERVKAIGGAGIRTIVSLLDEREQCALASDIRCVRLPIPDFSVPSQAGMRAILDAIDDSLAARQPVYVHCLGGVGRTGTVVGCWLRRHRLATRDSVLDLLASLRRADRERAHLTSPETPAQREMVLGWAE